MPSPPSGPLVWAQKFWPPAGSPGIPDGDRGTPAADSVFGDRPPELENPLDAKAARTAPVTKTDRLITNRRLENASK